MASLELYVKTGPCKGLVLPLDGRHSLTIGRAPGNDLVLRDTKVSSQHARIDVGSGNVILTDLGSKNGTFIGEQQLSGSRELEPGNDVILGDSVIVLRATAPRRPRAARNVTPLPGSVPHLDTTHDLVLQPATHPGAPNMTKVQRNLAILHGVGALMSSERDVDRLLEAVMDLIFDTLPADRGSLLLVDEKGDTSPRVVRQSHAAGEDELQVPRTILSKVLGDGVSVLTADAGTDARLSEGSSIIAQSIRSAMCVPIRGKRRTLGVIYVDTVLSVGVFGEEDLHLLTTVGILTGTALENIELYERHVQTERMAAIGKVIAGLGHDIRNMLTALKGGIYLLDDILKSHEDSGVREAWEILRRGQESIGSLVQDMVNYTRRREPEWQKCDINDTARNALGFAVERARSRRVELTNELDDGIQPFWFDSRSVERCLLNLLTNAIDAVKLKTGRVVLSTKVLGDNERVRIAVEDNGKGIPDESREKVFDLFYSTKGSRGAGFGLAITKKIIDEHGGTIGFKSTVGEGTLFTIELPCRKRRPASREGSDTDSDPDGPA